MDGQLQLSLREHKVKALGVTELVRMVRETLEMNLGEYWVVGEISNARLAASNHLYFTLKDSRSAISVVMFRAALQRVRFKVADGMEVMVRGRVNLYEARGTLQFYAEEMEPRGLGALQLAFEQLKNRLGAEGLFDLARKRPLPFLPRTIGLVTALGSAAIRDMITTIFGRYPNVELLVRAAKVQGPGSAEEVAQAIADLNRHGLAEVIIVGRGGGSLEDLWAFNEEVVARAIHDSRIPVISAVGHEVDYTIADFVADARAATPTAAGQMVVPRKADLKQRLEETEAALLAALNSDLAVRQRHLTMLAERVRDPRNLLRQARQRLDEAALGLQSEVRRALEMRRKHLDLLGARVRAPIAETQALRMAVARLGLHLAQTMAAIAANLRLRGERLAGRLNEPALRQRIDTRRGRVATLEERLLAATRRTVERERQRLARLGARLDSLSPLRVLERGYSVVVGSGDGRVVTDAAAVAVGDELEIRLNRGRLRAQTVAREV